MVLRKEVVQSLHNARSTDRWLVYVEHTHFEDIVCMVHSRVEVLFSQSSVPDVDGIEASRDHEEAGELYVSYGGLRFGHVE